MAERAYRDAGVDYAVLDAFKRKCMRAASLTDTFMQRPPSAELLAARAAIRKGRSGLEAVERLRLESKGATDG